MIQSVTIQPEDVLLGEVSLIALRDATNFLSAFTPASRKESIRMHPAGTRIQYVWDQLGLVAYTDYPDVSMSHLHIALNPTATPGHPEVPFGGSILLNGAFIGADTSEQNLPQSGITPVIKEHLSWSYCARDYTLHFEFSKRLNSDGKKTGSKKLAYLSFSWRS